MNVTVHVDKVKADHALQRYIEAVTPGQFRYVLRQGAAVIRKAAQERAPRRTGKLRRNLGIRTDTEKNTVQVFVRDRAFYGKFHEFGTRKMSARPWLRPALDASRDAALARIKDVLRERAEGRR